MKEYRLDFGTFFHHDNGILESLINEDIELTVEMVQEFFNLIKSITPKINVLLVNRKNKYSYTFKANIMLATGNQVDHVAVVKYGRLPWPINNIFKPKFYRLAFFDDRDDAISWLLTKISPTG